MLSYTDVPDRPAYESYRAMAAHDQRFHDLVLELSGNETARLSFARTHCHLHCSGCTTVAASRRRRCVSTRRW